MKNFILSIVFLLASTMSSIGEDLIGEISSQFGQGNAKQISRYFSSTVNLSILDDSNVYSKVQAEIILDTFFKMNQPTSSKIIHRLDNNPNYQHAVIELKTTKGDFRVSYSMRINNRITQLGEIRIERAVE